MSAATTIASSSSISSRTLPSAMEAIDSCCNGGSKVFIRLCCLIGPRLGLSPSSRVAPAPSARAGQIYRHSWRGAAYPNGICCRHSSWRETSDLAGCAATTREGSRRLLDRQDQLRMSKRDPLQHGRIRHPSQHELSPPAKSYPPRRVSHHGTSAPGKTSYCQAGSAGGTPPLSSSACCSARRDPPRPSSTLPPAGPSHPLILSLSHPMVLTVVRRGKR